MHRASPEEGNKIVEKMDTQIEGRPTVPDTAKMLSVSGTKIQPECFGSDYSVSNLAEIGSVENYFVGHFGTHYFY